MFGCRVGVGAEVAHALELNGLTDRNVAQRRFEIAFDSDHRFGVEIVLPSLPLLDVVGILSLMLTVEGGGAYELAQDENASLKSRVEEVDEQKRKTETVVLGSGTSAEVVVTHSRYPRFVGALIVCEGGDRADVQLKVTQAVSALTGLSSERISVVKGTP